MNSLSGLAGRSCPPEPYLPSITVHRKGAALVYSRRAEVRGQAQRRDADVSMSAAETSVHTPSEWQSESSTAKSSFLESSSDDNDEALHLKVEDVVKIYDTPKGLFHAVNNVSLDFTPGSIVVFLGPSGSGKTSLLRVIAGLEDVTSGKVYFDGEDVTNTPVQDRNLGMVFQSYALFRHMTVANNVAFGLRMRNLPVDKDQRVSELLDIVELTDLGDRYPSQLSGGQRQRVALARALACSPRILLLDEPFGALDALVRQSLRANMKSIVRSLGLTTIIVTHDQDEAFDLADEVVVINRGFIEQVGTPDDIKTSPASPFVLDFVSETESVQSTSQFMRRLKFKTDKPLVMFRPSDIQFFKEPDSDLFPITIVDSRHVGYRVVYQAKFDDGQEIRVPVTTEEYDNDIKNFEAGQRLYVKIDHEHLMGYHADEVSNSMAQ